LRRQRPRGGKAAGLRNITILSKQQHNVVAGDDGHEMMTIGQQQQRAIYD
jgi:hypothetical protein